MRVALLALLVFATPVLAEEGRWTLFELRKKVGSESFSVELESGARIVSSTLDFRDRQNRIFLRSRLRIGAEGAIETLERSGTVSRMQAVQEKIEAIPGGFAIQGYAPYAAQRELVRYWLRHGRPARIPRCPEGELRFERRGETEVAGKKLERLALSGLVWGEESLWVEGDELVAVVGWNAECDRFAAVRSDMEGSLGALEEEATRDQLRRFPAAPVAGKLAIVGGNVLVGRELVKGGVVVIEGDRIVAVGPSTTEIPPDATRLDATGKTVLPGLIDMHAHYEQVDWGPAYLAAGVTTVRDCGNDYPFLETVRREVKEGRVAGPRILVAGLVDAGERAWGTIRADDVESARRVVADFHRRGFEQVKVYDSISGPVLEALSAAAHERGMTVTGHVPLGLSATEAVTDGLDQISHILCADQLKEVTRADAIAFFKTHGTVIDPTMALYELVFRPFSRPLAKIDPGAAKVPLTLEPILEGWGDTRDRGIFADSLGYLKAIHAAGVPIVAGSDQAIPGHSVHRELELYVEAGFTPLEAIEAATTVPAQVMKLDDTGLLAKGKRADITVVEGAPLERVSDVRRVWRTVAAGRLYEPTEQWRRVDFGR
ncbi:MAG TPA: amidohydrolase family protein [Planctomycetota bacterium]|nr:amidohydrolase family protein [Planctomycetota bacterium]